MKTKILGSRRLPFAIRMALFTAAGLVTPLAFAQATPQATPQAIEPANSGTPPANATTTTLKSVIVTGSRIRQVDLQTQQPVLVMTREQIKLTGLTTVNDVLEHLDTIQTSPGSNRQATQGATAGSFADMRGLGSQRVLVLVNGHRWMTNNGGSTDLATIPASVIDHIEILKDGASAIYGSDAVSGVINIITRKNFQGMEASGYVGANQEGDGQTQQYSVTLGSGPSNKGSIMMNLAYNNQDIIWARDRQLTTYPNGPRHPTTSYYASGPLGSFTDSQGKYVLKQTGLDTTDLANYNQVDPKHVPVADQYNNFLVKPFRTPRQSKSAYIQGQYNFTDNLSFYSTTMYIENRGWNQMAGFPLQSHFFNLSNGLLSKDSIYNPVDQDVSIGINYIGHPRSVTDVTRSAQEIAGLKGAFPLFGHDWTWDAGLDYSKSSGTENTLNNLNYYYIQQAIGPSFINSEGQPECGTSGNPIGACIPLNILAGDQAIKANPALASKVFITAQDQTMYKDMSYSANVTGGLFDIPFGDEVAVALGAEHRRMSGFDLPDAYTQSGLSSNNTAAPTSGSYSVNSVYAELSVPLLKDLPWAKLLAFDGATRYSHYSNFGGTTNSKLGIQYKPIDDLMIRANYAQAFRAPTINDLDAGVGQNFGNFTDPCDAVYGTNIYGASVHNACVASLRTAGYSNPDQFRQQSLTGGPVSAPNMQMKNPSYSGGNPLLKPETAIDKTLGIVYSPHYVPGLGLTLDWYQIKLDNIISPVTSNDVLQECYQGVQIFCNRFQRDADGQVLNMATGSANRGTALVQGYDLAATYELPEMPVGQFRITSTVAYTDKWQAQQTPTAPTDNRVGMGVSAGYFWRVRSNTSLGWSKGDFGANWRIRYFSSLTEGCFWGTSTECSKPDHIDPFNGVFPENRIGAIAFNDVSFHWHSPWQALITVGVNNVFNRAAPIDYQAGGPPVNPASDIDRFFFLSYDQKFN